jgi:phage N-6-adenine-methyltransferase
MLTIVGTMWLWMFL